MGVTGQNRESHEKEKDWIQVACQNANPRSALVFAVQTLLLLLLIIELGLTRNRSLFPFSVSPYQYQKEEVNLLTSLLLLHIQWGMEKN